MARFGIDVTGTSDMGAILREADRLANGVGSRISRLQQKLAAGDNVNPQRALTNIQAFGERQIRGQARTGELSVTEFKKDLRDFRASMAKVRAQLETELSRSIPEPPRRDVRVARRADEARSAAATRQARPPAAPVQFAPEVQSQLDRLRQTATGRNSLLSPAALDPSSELARIRAIGERQIRARGESGEISTDQVKRELRAFRAQMVKARTELEEELNRVIPAPSRSAQARANKAALAPVVALTSDPETLVPSPRRLRRSAASFRRVQQANEVAEKRAEQERLAEETRIADESARLASNRQQKIPKKRGGTGGDKDAKYPLVPTEAEIDKLEDLLKGGVGLGRLRSLAKRAGGIQRHIGQTAGFGIEEGIAEFDTEQTRKNQPTTKESAGRLEYIRRKRITEEETHAARLADEDADLARATGELAASRRKFRHASDRALIAATDPTEEARTAQERRELNRRNLQADRATRPVFEDVQEGRARKEFRQVVKAVEHGVDPVRDGTAQQKADRDAIIAVKERTAALHRSRLAVEQTATSDKRLVSAQAEEIAETAKLAIAKRRQTAAANAEAQRILKGPASQGGLSGAERGTRFQRIQADIASRSGGGVRIPAEFQTFRKFAESKAITTAGFALSGAVLYGAVSGIKTIISESENLEKILNQVQAQFDSIGEGEAFPGFRNSILAIARETGAASDEVASIAFQMKGAFGETTTAVEATSAAIKIAKVTGLELNEIVDSLTASALSFSNASKGISVSVEQVGDVALGLQERFGVLAKETLKGVADVAPVADQVGLKLIEISTLLAGTQQLSGRSGAAIAEGFNRALPALQGVSIEVLKLYSQVPALAGSLDELSGQVARGESGQVLLGLLRDFDKFNKTQQSAVFELLGGRREAQFLIPLFGNRKKILNSLDTDLKETGKTQAYFNKLQETLANTLERLSESFKQAGEALFRAGLATGLTDAADAIKVLVDGIRIGLSFLADLDDALGHLPIRLAQAAFAFKALSVLIKGIAGTRLAGGLLAGIAGRATTQAGIGSVAPGTAARLAAQGSAAQAAARAAGARTTLAGARAAVGSAASSTTAALGGLPGIATTVGLAGFFAYQQKRTDRDANEKALLEKFKEYDSTRLKRLAKDRGDFWDRVSGAVFDGRPQSETSQAASKTLALKTTAPEVDDFVASRQAEILKNLDKADRERLEALIEQRTKGKDSPKSAFDRLRDIRGITNPLLFTVDNEDDKPKPFDVTPEALDKLQIEALKEPTGKAALTIKTVNEFLRQTAGLGQKFRDAIKGRAANLDVGEVKNLINSGQALQGVQEIESQLQAGLASPVDALQEYRATVAAFEKVLAAGGKLQEDKLREYREIKSKEAKLNGDLARQFVDRQVRIEAASGKGNAESALAKYIDLLRSNKVTDPRQRRDLVDEIDKQQGEILQSKIAAGKDAVEQARIAREGIRVPDEARLVELESQLNDLDTTWQNFLKVAFGSVEKGAAFTHETAVGILAGVGTPAELAKSKIAKLRADLLAQRRLAGRTGEPTKGIDAQLKALGAVDSGEVKVAVPDEIRRADQDRQAALQKAADDDARRKSEALIKANIALRQARAGNDPVALAQLAVEEAELLARSAAEDGDQAGQIQAAADKVRALRQVEDARLDILKAQIELAQAISERDPLVVAKLAVRQAELNARIAAETGGAADRIRAAAEKLRAQRQEEDALADVFQAKKEFAQTLAEIAGDTVGAAEIGVSILEDQLRRTIAAVKSAGGDPASNAEVVNLQGQLAQANKAVQTTDFEKKLSDIDFFLQMEKTTTAQAIAQLEGLLQIADPAQTRELLLKIKSLRDQAGQDLQFNIPNEIRLPTLYEVRRTSQTERAGGGYQDFRTITVSMVNNNATDYQGSIDKFTDLVDRAPRVYGTTATAY